MYLVVERYRLDGVMLDKIIFCFDVFELSWHLVVELADQWYSDWTGWQEKNVQYCRTQRCVSEAFSLFCCEVFFLSCDYIKISFCVRLYKIKYAYSHITRYSYNQTAAFELPLVLCCDDCVGNAKKVAVFSLF